MYARRASPNAPSKRRPQMYLATTGVLALSVALTGGSSAPASRSQFIPFDEAVIYVEYNATDDDAEVVVSIDADLGLDRFAVIAPNGKEVLSLRAKKRQDLGIRKIALETPEPTLAEVLAAYPPGCYGFFGRSVDGQSLFSSAWLSHELPQAPSLEYPQDGDVDVPTSGAAASWSAGPSAESFFLELEQDELGVDVKSNIAGGTTSFGFPEGWLAAKTEYQLGIAARACNGNLTVVEVHFTTGH